MVRGGVKRSNEMEMDEKKGIREEERTEMREKGSAEKM